MELDYAWLLMPTILAVLSFIPAVIADRKGHSFVSFYIFGLLANVFAIAWAILVPPNNTAIEARKRKSGEVRCQHCREFVRYDATVCPHCRRDISPEIGAAAAQPMALGH